MGLIWDLGYGKNLSLIPDTNPAVKKAPDPRSATTATKEKKSEEISCFEYWMFSS
jgi:hypothetical protein